MVVAVWKWACESAHEQTLAGDGRGLLRFLSSLQWWDTYTHMRSFGEVVATTYAILDS